MARLFSLAILSYMIASVFLTANTFQISSRAFTASTEGNNVPYVPHDQQHVPVRNEEGNNETRRKHITDRNKEPGFKGDKERKYCTSVQEFQPAPDGGWESLAPEQRPNWWRPEGSVHPPEDAKVALAFRGHYHRYSQEGFRHCPEIRPACSDYWVSKDNIERTIVEPLKAAKVDLRVYIHTYSDTACPVYDTALLQDLRPSQYKIDTNTTDPVSGDLTNTYVQVMKLVMEDNWADYIVLMRFDVKYNAPITSWNLEWNAVNYPFLESKGRNNNDLVFTVPKKWFGVFMDGMQERHDGLPSAQINLWMEANAGQSSVHQIDEHSGPAASAQRLSFLGIVRECSKDYLKCR